MSYCSRSRRRRFTVLDFKSGAFTAIFSNICTAHTQERLFMNFRCLPIWIKFCMVVDITDIVTYTNFGDHRLRGLWVAGGQISPFPIDFHRRPYNTLALPCECVMKFPASDLISVSTGYVWMRVRINGIEVCTGMETAGIPRNLRVSRGCGYECCGNTAGMDLTIAGFPRGWIFITAGTPH